MFSEITSNRNKGKLVQALPIPAFLLHPNGKILSYNSTAAKLFGNSHPLQGREFGNLISNYSINSFDKNIFNKQEVIHYNMKKCHLQDKMVRSEWYIL